VAGGAGRGGVPGAGESVRVALGIERALPAYCCFLVSVNDSIHTNQSGCK
jgi:hypothetical protein